MMWRRLKVRLTPFIQEFVILIHVDLICRGDPCSSLAHGLQMLARLLHKSKSSLYVNCKLRKEVNTHICIRFLTFFPQTAFSLGPVASLNASRYASCSPNMASASAQWWLVLGFPPPFEVDTFAPGLGNSPCLMTGSSVMAAMRDHVSVVSLQLLCVSMMRKSESDLTYSIFPPASSSPACVSSEEPSL